MCGMEFYFLKYVITDAWYYAIAPGPLGGRGEVAMSPPRCARLFSLRCDFGQDVGARGVKFPAYSAKCLEFNVSLSRHRCFWSWGVV